MKMKETGRAAERPARGRRAVSERELAIEEGTRRFLARGFSEEEARSYARLFYEEGQKTRKEFAGLSGAIQALLSEAHA